ncbi:ABC transporter [Massarina eburnea CBS 473.64]|uniref:ABC transporter n=1 Tax=Massarina eburnea CBS 473.64 TaxID=1395130 RepID=A0A6A6RNH8_9PLEO|nr:ABC transporter [Massarina eburnea CBS 473.64]
MVSILPSRSADLFTHSTMASLDPTSTLVPWGRAELDSGRASPDGLPKLIAEYSSIRNGQTEHERHDSSIVFNGVSVEGWGTGSQAAPTVVTAAKSIFGLLSPFLHPLKKEPYRPILHNFSGVLNSGEMLLVIGKPGSGCSTFLKMLANTKEEYKDIQGELTMGGELMDKIVSESPQDVVVCAEDDQHFPTLTVAETLTFALRSRCDPSTPNAKVQELVTLLAKLVGLHRVLNTKVGNEYIRGVSGGERRRVSLAEALASSARLLCFDNPTKGLDSSTALEFMEMMREWTTQNGCATAMSIYQGSNDMVPLFDKVVVINSGRQIFYGKVADAESYFQNLGFHRTPTVTITDFLNSMSADPDVRSVVEGHERQVPLTSSDFETSFRSSQYQAVLDAEIEQHKRRPPKKSEVVKKSPFSLPLYHQIWLCLHRQYRILLTDYSIWTVEPATIIIQSVILGTLFRAQPHETKSFLTLGSALFFSTLVPALQSMNEFGNTFAQRPLVLKHKRYRLYRPSAYALALVLTDAVWKIAAISYNIPLYFMTGLQPTAGNFFTWFFIVYIEHLALSMFFRSIALFSRNVNLAILPVGIFFNMYVLYTGLYIPPPQMQIWLGWLKYLNPIYYGFESVMLNEFATLSYTCSPSDVVPFGQGYTTVENQVCAVPGSQSGTDQVSGMSYLHAQYGFQASHKWRNVAINVGLFVAFSITSTIGMELLKTPAGRLATVFYKASPSTLPHASGSGSDSEKGRADDSAPPLTQSISRKSRRSQVAVMKDHTFSWSHMSLDVKTKDGERRLLDDLSGWVRSGQMKCLMGVSGAGKTTLLNTLAGRSSIGKLTGELVLNGKELPKSFRRYMGYVQQDDIHLPTQTVREALQMTAKLRGPVNISTEQKNDYVETVIEWLEMCDIADALIGVPGAGLNLEQRKRVTIGVEMAAKPEILFLDEPTSGLDGQSAHAIVRLLRKVADSGQAILCTIHQPAAELVEIFDELYLLAQGGKLVYDGPLGDKCDLAVRYFEQHANPYESGQNPAEYFLNAIGAGTRKEKPKDWPYLWKSSELNKSRADDQAEMTRCDPNSSLVFDNSTSTYSVPFHVQLSVVLKRTWLYYWRDPDYVTSKLWMSAGNALLNSLTYLQSPNTQRGAYNRVFSAFMALIVGPPIGLQVEPRFFALRDIFLHREQASLTYHWLVFVLSAIIIEIPYALISGLVYWLLWYFPVGNFTTPSRAGYVFLMYELFTIFATSLAQLSASVFPNLNSAFAGNGFFFMFVNSFAGTLSPEPVTPRGWKWYYKVSPLFYVGEGNTVSVLQDLKIQCDASETSMFQPPNGSTCGEYAANFLKSATGYLINHDSTESCQYCRYRDGQSYYLQWAYEFGNRWKDIGIIIGFITFNYTMVIAFVWLLRVKKWRVK